MRKKPKEKKKNAVNKRKREHEPRRKKRKEEKQRGALYSEKGRVREFEKELANVDHNLRAI